jgi:hypothetical protein
MTDRTYPRQVWVLTPSFKPKEVTVTGKYDSYIRDYGDVTKAGKSYSVGDMYSTSQDAIAAGWASIGRQRNALSALSAEIDKKVSALTKAAKELQ